MSRGFHGEWLREDSRQMEQHAMVQHVLRITYGLELLHWGCAEMHLATVVFAIAYCCNKLPQNWWLAITQIYYPTNVEVRSPKWVSLGWNQGTSRPACLLQVLEEYPFFCHFQVPQAACFYSFPLPSSYPWLSESYIVSLGHGLFCAFLSI